MKGVRLHLSFRSAFGMGAAAILASGAWGSFVSGNNAMAQTVAAGTQDQVIRVLGTQGSGSGAIFHNERIGDYRYLCLVTADHVVTGNAGITIGFEGNGATGGRFSVDPTGANNGVIFHGGRTGLQDYAFMAIRARVGGGGANALTAAQEAYLAGVQALGLIAAPIANYSFTGYGYGRGGHQLNQNNVQVGVQWSNANANEAFGTHRYYNNTVTAFLNNLNQGGYTYNRVEWVWDINSQAGEGQGNRGDSGGPLLVNGAPGMIGNNPVNTDGITGVLTQVYGDGGYNLYQGGGQENFYYGSIGRGVRFIQDDVDWLEQRCAAFVPEPSGLAVVGIGLLALSRKRRRA